jgi:hypothetical protein
VKSVVLQAISIVWAAAVLAAVGFLDYRLHYQIGLFVLYALPIAWIAWSVSFGWSVLLVLASTIVRVLTDDAWIHHSSHTWMTWERGGMRTIVLLFIVFSFRQFRSDLAERSRKVRQLEGILPVCIACNRIRESDSTWVDLETYLRRNSEATPQPRLCPDCTGIRHR